MTSEPGGARTCQNCGHQYHDLTWQANGAATSICPWCGQDLTWRIDPKTHRLVGPERIPTREVEHQTWPPCPVCGTTVGVDLVDVTELGNPESMSMVTCWACPQGCDPRAQPATPR